MAHLARLQLSDEELVRYSQDFEGILGYISQLNEIAPAASDAVSAMLSGHARADDAVPSGAADAVIGGFPDKDGRQLRVPQVLSYED